MATQYSCTSIYKFVWFVLLLKDKDSFTACHASTWETDFPIIKFKYTHEAKLAWFNVLPAGA